jgi:hypothetical protein
MKKNSVAAHNFAVLLEKIKMRKLFKNKNKVFGTLIVLKKNTKHKIENI